MHTQSWTFSLPTLTPPIPAAALLQIVMVGPIGDKIGEQANHKLEKGAAVAWLLVGWQTVCSPHSAQNAQL
jgi:hypothetical protein